MTVTVITGGPRRRSHFLSRRSEICLAGRDAVLLFCPVLAQRRPGGLRKVKASLQCYKFLINDLNILKHLDILRYTWIYIYIFGTGWTAERELSELWWYSCLWEQSWRNLKGKTTSVPEAATVLRSRMSMVVNVCTLLIPINYIHTYHI